MCNYTIAYAYHLKTLAAQEKRLGLNHMQTAVTLSYLAAVRLQLGDSTTAHDYLEKALLIWQQNHAGQHPKTAVTLIRMGEWHETQGDKPSAELNYTQAVALLEEHAVETHYELKRVLENLVRVGK